MRRLGIVSIVMRLHTIVEQVEDEGRVSCPTSVWRGTQRAFRVAGLLALVLAGSLMANGVSALAASPLSWSAPTLIDSSSAQPELDAVSCPSASLCVGVDRFGGIVTSTDPAGDASAWSFAQVGGTYKPNEPCESVPLCLRGVSCPSSTLCVAVGAHGQVLVSSDPAGGAGAWRQSEVDEGHALLGVSCPSTELCVAVDSAGDVLTSADPGGGAGAWSATHLVEQVLRAVSCASESLCVAVDQAGDVVASKHPTAGAIAWTVSSVASTPLLGVSCTEHGGSLCAAVGGEGDVVTSTEPGIGGWTTTGKVDGSSTAIAGVSCPSVSLCVATDGAGNALSSTDPTGGVGAWTPSHVDAEESLFGVFCASESLCVAVNGHGDVLSTDDPTAGVWASAHVDSDNPPRVYNVSCPTVSLCVAADDAKNIISTTDPTGGSGAWGESQMFTSMWGVSCASPSLCIAGNESDTLVSTEPNGGSSAWHATEDGRVHPTWPLPPHFAPHFRAACPSATLCVVVEALGSVIMSTAPTAPESWSPVFNAGVFPLYEGPQEADNEVDPVFGVSCPSVSLCAAVDSHGYVSVTTDPGDGGNSIWAPVRIDGEIPFEDVSCPSVSLCVAVDEKGNVLSSIDPTGGAGAWSLASVDPGHAITGVSCPSESLCVAVDEDGNALTSTDPAGGAGAWSAVPMDSGHALTSVSCVPEGLCVAVDDAGYAVTGTFAPQAGGGGGGGGEPGNGGSPAGPTTSTTTTATGPSKPPPGVLEVLSADAGRDGQIVLRLDIPGAGSIDARATASVRKAADGSRKRKSKRAREITYGTALATAPGADTMTVTIKPAKSALGALKSSRSLRTPVTIVFHPRSGSPTTVRQTVTVRYSSSRRLHACSASQVACPQKG
jgi:hypothetical protein